MFDGVNVVSCYVKPLRRRNWVLLLMLATVGCVAQADDLVSIYAKARDADPVIKAARHEMAALLEAKPQALAALLPKLSYEYDKTYTRQSVLRSNNPVYAQGVANYTGINQTLTLTQPIFKLSSWIGYGQAEDKVKQAVATYAAAEQDAMVRTATAYLAGLAAGDALALATAERDAIKRQLDLVEARYRSKLVAVVDLHEARARFAIKDADVLAARDELEDRRQALREITTEMPGALVPLRANWVPLSPQPADVDHWVSAAESQNLLTEARRHAVAVARQEMRRQQAEHAPVLDLVATDNRNDTGGSLFGGGSKVSTEAVMLRLMVPIFSGGATVSLAREATERYLQSMEDMERQRRQAERQARAAFLTVKNGVARIKAFDEGVVSAESASRLRVEGYAAGINTTLQVLDAERELFAAKRDAAKARYDYFLNRLKLKQAVGTLSEVDLADISREMLVRE